MRRRSKGRKVGFTLMEVLLVLVIVAILGSMAGVYFRGVRQKALQDASRAQILTFKKAIEIYQLNVGSFPTSEQGLPALIEPPSDLPNPAKWGTSPYLESKTVPLDPWDHEYNYQLVDANNYRIWSYGPDGIDGTEDDVLVEGR